MLGASGKTSVAPLASNFTVRPCFFFILLHLALDSGWKPEDGVSTLLFLTTFKRLFSNFKMPYGAKGGDKFLGSSSATLQDNNYSFRKQIGARGGLERCARSPVPRLPPPPLTGAGGAEDARPPKH